MAAKPARALVGAAALVLGSGVVATQLVAAIFHYPTQFGSGWIDVARQRIYAPWSFLTWYARYQRTYPHAFDGAALAGYAVIALPCLFLIAHARRGRPTPSVFGQGAWAQLADVRRAGFIRPDGAPAGRVLGRFDGKLLTYQGVEHGIIVAPSRSGKGAGHVVPTACAWAQSAMIYDRKGELWHITADHRRRFSHTFYFAPTDPDTARWNPLFEVRKGPLEIADI